MDSNEVKQKGNVVEGDQAGRDIHKHEHFHLPPAQQLSQMARMILKYRTEAANDSEIKVTIEQLQRWQKRPTGDVMGLEEKLRNGNRPDVIDTAIAAKDRFAKLLTKHEYSCAAQEIYAYLLAKIHQLFSSVVYTKISRGGTPEEIDKLLVTEVYDRVETILEDNPLGITPEEVVGMLFWLTGNCHLKWNSNANLQSSI
jgi:hypothetical protein